MILETDPILFIVTMIVSCLHSIFEMLAIKNDISFWKNVESHKGLSLKTLNYSLFISIVIFLYLLDNDTNKMILVTSFIEIIVNIWKILKTNKIQL
tara:strand:- start:620 stop:907 length:288 start_codon:yes stop_codon:yes gene_type:complete